MSSQQKLPVSHPKGMQPATFPGAGATSLATTNATSGLKALAGAYLQRQKCNPACNPSATSPQNECNFSSCQAPPRVAPPSSPLSDTPRFAHDVDAILDALLNQVGRPLKDDLAQAIQQAMQPMSREARAVLADDIDQCFEHVQSVQQAHQAVMALLGKGEEAQRPNSRPESTRQTPSNLADRIDWIAEQCPLLADDRYHLAKCLAPMSLASLKAAAQRYVSIWQQAAEAEPLPACKTNAGRRAANLALLQETMA